LERTVIKIGEARKNKRYHQMTKVRIRLEGREAGK
jgi:hypothetical protein